ncbi:MAG TPA: hypothetical protein VK539_22275 [Myxococcaceae bacterium]|nr:hypothetical protein [Myxococcaceae bacterium]
MRGGRGVGLVLCLALGACRERPAALAVDAGVSPMPVARVGPGCEVLLPEDVRELVLPGASLREERTCATCGPLCTLRSLTEPDTTVSFAYSCEPRAPATEVRELMAPTLKAGGTEVPALGRAAAQRSPAPGMLQVMAWDDDTPCALVVTWLGQGNERAVDIMRSALQAVTTQSLTPPPVVEEPGPPAPAAEDAGTLPTPP